MEFTKSSETAGKSIRCKAAISRKAGEALVIEEIEVEAPKDYEVRIKILCTSLCHTDFTFWKSTTPPFAALPRIFGHEAVGIVESVGAYVEEVKEGDMVLPVFTPECGECRDCKSEKSNMCLKFGEQMGANTIRDGTSRFKDSKGEIINHFMFVSSFTEYTVVDITHVVKISPDIPVDKACLFSCGAATGIGAAWKVADVGEGSTVAVFGLGAVGLAVAEGARLRGASKIIAVDLNPAKFEIGKKFGVTHFINPTTCGEETVSQVIKKMTDGGTDYSFECIGLASVMQEAFTSTRQGWGKTVILGVEMHGSPLSVNSREILNGKTICGSVFGGFKPKSDIPILIQKYIAKELNLDALITHEVKFEDINKAFDLLLQGKSLRCIIWMDKQN